MCVFNIAKSKESRNFDQAQKLIELIAFEATIYAACCTLTFIGLSHDAGHRYGVVYTQR